MFNDEIKQRLVDMGVGTYGSNIISGSKGVIPDGDGPFLSIIETGGTAPLRVHNEARAHVQRPSAQILVRGKTMLRRVRWRWLHIKRLMASITRY